MNPVSGVEDRGYVRRPFDTLLTSRGNIAALRVLAGSPAGATGREIARQAGLAPMPAHQALARLERSGIVRRLPAGRSHVFHLNLDHVLVQEALLPLFEREVEFRERLRRVLGETLAPKVSWGGVYGSVARREDKPASDLDVCLLVEKDSEKETASSEAARMSDRVWREYGVRLSPIVFSRREFIHGWRSEGTLFQAIVRDAESFAGGDLKGWIYDKQDTTKGSRPGRSWKLRGRRA